MALLALCTGRFSTDDSLIYWLKRRISTPAGDHIQYEKKAKLKASGNALRFLIAKSQDSTSNIEIGVPKKEQGLAAGKEVTMIIELVLDGQHHPEPCVKPAGIDVLRWPSLKKVERLGISLHWEDDAGQQFTMYHNQPYESTARPAFLVLHYLDWSEKFLKTKTELLKWWKEFEALYEHRLMMASEPQDKGTST